MRASVRPTGAAGLRRAPSTSSWRGQLLGVVALGTLVPLSLHFGHREPPETAAAPSDAEEAMQLAGLAKLAQRNEQLLRQLAEMTTGAIGPADAAKPSQAFRASVAVPVAAPVAAAEAPMAAAVARPAVVPAYASTNVWLRMAIVSIGRKDGAEYLLRTLVSILEQLPAHDPLSAHVEVLVINNQEPPEKHAIFARAKELYGAHPSARFVAKRLPSPLLRCPGKPGKVTPGVQRQTCDLVAAINAVLDAQPEAAHVMMMEDDWLFCPSGFDSLRYFMAKAHRYDPRWMALRVSYGFNGVVVRGADLPALQAHLAKHFERRPPDHLLFEWFSGEKEDTKQLAAGRSYRIFRHNLFFHIGTKSTINQPAHRFIPACYSLLYDWLLPAEVFNEKECPNDDVWPCKEAALLEPTDFATPRVVWSAEAFKTTAPLSPLDSPRARPGASSFGLSSAPAAARPADGTPQRESTPAQPVMAHRSESCAAACARDGRGCDEAMLSEVNSCEALRRVFDCSSCSPSIGADQPAFVARDAPLDSQPGACLFTDGDFSCAGSHPMTTRLCMCT